VFNATVDALHTGYFSHKSVQPTDATKFNNIQTFISQIKIRRHL